MIPVTFLSERLSLNLVTEEDHAFITALVNSEGWLKFIGDRNVHSEASARRYIRKILSTENLYYWVVSIRETRVPAGIISVIKRSYLENFDIGFAFLPAYEGQGYAFEAAKTVLASLTNDAGFNTILATTLPGNQKSIRLLEKLGLQFSKEITHETETLLLFQTTAE